LVERASGYLELRPAMRQHVSRLCIGIHLTKLCKAGLTLL